MSQHRGVVWFDLFSDPAPASAFEAPEPPTGPEARVPTRVENQRAAYREWRDTEDGALAWLWIRDKAQSLMALGRLRISVNALVEGCREANPGVAINNTWRAWIADDLVVSVPGLLDVIERRRRRK